MFFKMFFTHKRLGIPLKVAIEIICTSAERKRASVFVVAFNNSADSIRDNPLQKIALSQDTA